MPRRDTHDWTFPELLSAFLDLAIAYLLLCGSILVYLASKFLGFFGSSLPSSHNERFDEANQRECLKENLLDCASEKIYAVNCYVKTKIPFDSVMADDSNQYLKPKSVNDSNGDIDNVGCGAESSFKFSPIHQDLLEDVAREEQSSTNSSKNSVNPRSRNVLRNRNKAHVDFRKLLPISTSDTSWSRASNDVSRIEAADSEDCKNAMDEISLKQNGSHGSEFDETPEDHEQREQAASPGESFDRNAENTTRILKEALEEERTARAAMWIELERERSAAASAADEAMAMILRLQDEKASIEMEAMQFKRMIEEKSAFDAEEMNIMKDILLQREREKHFLEKEVEAYRQILIENDELVSSESFIEGEKIEKPGEAHQEPTGNHGFQEKMITLMEEEEAKEDDNGRIRISQDKDLDTGWFAPKEEDNDTEKSREDAYKSDSEIYSRVRDVHVVNNGDDSRKMQNADEKNLEASDYSIISRHRSQGSIVSDVARRLPPLCRPRGTTLNSIGSRRKSMSAVDYERLKIENEVGLLRERLKAVREGREKLITRGTSLPPLSSKAKSTSKKRSCRSSSLELNSS